MLLKAGTDLEGVRCLVPVFCHSEFSWTEYPIASTISDFEVKKVQIFIPIILIIFTRLNSEEVFHEKNSQKAVFLTQIYLIQIQILFYIYI
jgi:hypothetical protein